MLIGKGGVEAGTALALVETKHKKWILDSVSVNVYGGKNLKTKDYTAGIGVEKKLFDIKSLINIGAGVYMTKPVKELLDLDVKPDVKFGISGSWRF